jgi:hypothetical protein
MADGGDPDPLEERKRERKRELEQRLSSEFNLIRDRRTQAHFADPSAPGANGQPPATPTGNPKNLVGLSLSGGGVRSASFNLGVIQAFYEHGLLRFVD